MSESRTQSNFIPVWLLLLPGLAVIGGVITLYLALRHPDQEIRVEKVSTVRDGQQLHQHVVNSVTPPLQ